MFERPFRVCPIADLKDCKHLCHQQWLL
jgi:hypothetical protein